MDTKTTFGSLAVGEKFREPGKTTDFRKTGERQARRLTDGIVFTFAAYRDVVPELGATVADILGSWSKL